EAIKITIPFGYKPHVSDVKKQALEDLQNGYAKFNQGSIKLISRYSGALLPDRVWDNSDNDFRSSAKHPILAVDTKYEDGRYTPLANIIDKIANEDFHFDEWEIFYLRDGFDGKPYYFFS
ncbi:hypothetical protein EC991_004787, partial [Linnemannia zychae]